MKKLISLIIAIVMLFSCVTVIAQDSSTAQNTFRDVKKNAWYKEAVNFVSSKGIMKGDGSEDTFLPEKLMSRAMIVTVLWRMAGEPATSDKFISSFTDLTQNWYKNAVLWANENNIVNGKSETSFDPDSPVTREQLVTILGRYLVLKNIPIYKFSKVKEFSDTSKISNWARESMNWAVYNEILNGILDADGNVSLSPSLGSTRAQCATIISRICEKYGLLETAEPFFPANMEEILADLKSDRVKKVIFDADAGNEIDDQYALAYALGCDKLDVISVSASQFLNKALVPTRNEGMLEGYRELKRVLKLLGRESIPVYKGVGDTTTKKDDDGIKYPTVLPYSADAVTNIINTANSSNEIIYIITTGCATNIACALAKDPSIKDKICVVWLGANLPDEGAACEFNFGQDPTAGRYMMNSGVPLVWLPAMSNDSTKGTQVLKTNRAFLDRSFTGEDAASSFFRYDLPVEHDVFIMLTPDTWEHTFWDVAAPIVLDHPELCELEIINTPRIRGDELYSFEENRPEAIILNRITDPSKALDYMAEAINKLVK